MAITIKSLLLLEDGDNLLLENITGALLLELDGTAGGVSGDNATFMQYRDKAPTVTYRDKTTAVGYRDKVTII